MNKKIFTIGLGGVMLAATVLGMFGAAPAPKASAAAPKAAAWELKGNKVGKKAFLGSTNNRPLVFKTNNLERMRIEKDGKVGIGTASPLSKLHVLSAASDIPPRLESSGTTSFAAGFDFYHGIAPKGYVGVPNSAAPIGPGEMLLYGGGGTKTSLWAGGTKSVTIATNGNVGFGTDNPAAPVEITGGRLRLSHPGGIGDVEFTETADVIAFTTTESVDPAAEVFRVDVGTGLTRAFTVRADGLVDLTALADPASKLLCVNDDLMLSHCTSDAEPTSDVAKLRRENDALRQQLSALEVRLAALESAR